MDLKDKLIGSPFVRLTIDETNRLLLDYNGTSEILEGDWSKYCFHTKLREYACMSPGSVYEFRYKFFPPSIYCSLNGMKDLLDFIVPENERINKEPFVSQGVQLYFIKSNMEKFKIFKGCNEDPLHNCWNLRTAIERAFKESYDYQVPIKTLLSQDVAASRVSYFGAFVVPMNFLNVARWDSTIPGIALVGELKDCAKFQEDLFVWLVTNYNVFDEWRKQWE